MYFFESKRSYSPIGEEYDLLFLKRQYYVDIFTCAVYNSDKDILRKLLYPALFDREINK